MPINAIDGRQTIYECQQNPLKKKKATAVFDQFLKEMRSFNRLNKESSDTVRYSCLTYTFEKRNILSPDVPYLEGNHYVHLQRSIKKLAEQLADVAEEIWMARDIEEYFDNKCIGTTLRMKAIHRDLTEEELFKQEEKMSKLINKFKAGIMKSAQEKSTKQ